MKTYPRLGLDVQWPDLLAGLVEGSESELELEGAIASYWPTSRSIQVTLSVRSAFDLLLQALALPPGTQVLMSGVNVRHMVEIVRCHGLVPVPVDLDFDTLAPNLDHLHRLISPQTGLFVIAHLFGSIIPLAPYIALCRPYQIPLVEDCAQAFAGSYYLGDEQADVSFFSFGPIKTCSALGGGVALIGDETLAEKMREIGDRYPRKGDRWYRQRLLKYCALKAISNPYLYHALLQAIQRLGKDVDRAIGSSARGFSSGELIPQLRQKPPHLLLQFLAHRLKTCPNYQERINRAKMILTQLDRSIIWPGSAADQHSFWVVPIQTPSPQLWMEQLRNSGFDATQGNTSLIAIPTPEGNPLPQSQKLLQTLLYLPVSPALPVTEYPPLIQQINSLSHPT
ncbi:DegT/DnrJ/EryC1/StrS family aminotransferase [Roseofilum sp. BLCC_M91]|uniref:DegT/DnrJ/EryC1/StrS family aminotransferase n=1 Tax=Roseofilum halophilum BLCC-M91 TaxID=3022259 RepID=A0ABT7BK24_9CYAN|nr:DegT/DnrJ/EryC1/StrS family aminotransferase [Roseofilum halophilum]MDJ1179514.1 DegT/DnrJ/EryC1/StrS family aminotransferase [Roseofilum halophilum BLCC-M91]